MKPFDYKSREWQKLRARAYSLARGRCSVCGRDVQGYRRARVDHIIPVRARPDLAMRIENLRVLCTDCDAKRHSEKGGGVPRIPIGLDGFPE